MFLKILDRAADRVIDAIFKCIEKIDPDNCTEAEAVE